MAPLLSNDVLNALRSPDATQRRSAEAMLETCFSNEPDQVLLWFLERMSCAPDAPDRQMAAVLLRRRLPAVWRRVTPDGQKQTLETLFNVLQKETSRPVLVVTASAVVSLASQLKGARRATLVQNIIVFAKNILSAQAEDTREVGCIIIGDLVQAMRAEVSARDLDSLRSAVEVIVSSSLPWQLRLSAVSCLGKIAVGQMYTSGKITVIQMSTSLTCVAQLARTLLSDGVDSGLKEELLRACFEVLQEERPPQPISLEVAIMEIGSPRQCADERTQAQAIRVLTAAATRLPQLFGTEARRSCVRALCGLCRPTDDSDDADILPEAAQDGISILAEAFAAGNSEPCLEEERNLTVLELVLGFAANVCADSSETERSGALRCLAAALVGTFRAVEKQESQGVQSSSIRLPPNVNSAHELLAPFAVATADAHAVVRLAATDGLSKLVLQASSLQDVNVWAAVEDAIHKCMTNAAQDADVTVQASVVRMAKGIVLGVEKQRLHTLLSCIVPTTVALTQRAVPVGFENASSCEADWSALEDRLSVVAIVAESAGTGFSSHAIGTTTNLLRPLLSTPSIPISAKLVALRALGTVLASTGPPTSSGPMASLLPFWKDGLQTAAEAVRSAETRTQSLGFYAALAAIFQGRQESIVNLQGEIMEMMSLDLVVTAALAALNVPGATGEVGKDCEKTWCDGAATAILQGGPGTWVRTQAHEEARYALFALQACAAMDGQSFLKAAPEILPVLVPRFSEAVSPPIRLASLGLFEEMGRMVRCAIGSSNCSAQDSALLQDLDRTILQAVAAAMSTQPRSAPVCHEGKRVLTTLNGSGSDNGLIGHIAKGLQADKHHHDDDDDDDLNCDDEGDTNAVMRINGHRIAKRGG